jgi:hypothetical protein
MSEETTPTVPMTDIEIRVNGVSGIKYAQPATVEAYDTLAKSPGRCLADACQKQLFHSSYSDIRAGITEALVAAGHGAPRLFATAKKIIVTEVFEGEGDDKKLVGYVDDKGKNYKPETDISYEADKAFFDRVCAEQGVDATAFRDLIQEVANKNPFDPSRKQRTAGPRKIAKAYIETAQAICDAGQHEGAAAQIADLLDRAIDVSDPETRVMVLAAAIADNELREKREREAALKNKYAPTGA